jgi:hypothetical protein
MIPRTGRGLGGPADEAAGLKFLSYAREDERSQFACTFFDRAFMSVEGDRDLAVFLDASGWSTEKGITADRTSDPSVAATADGTVLTAWEERTFPGARPQTALLVKVRRALWVYGPSEMTHAGSVLEGGDVSVWLSATWMYVAFQGKTGGIYVYRSVLPAAVGSPFVWEPLGVLTDPAGVAGYIDIGYLPNLVGTTVDGVDYLAVVWERTDPPLTDNSGKLAALAFLRSDAAGFVIEGTPTTMNLGKAYGEFRFQLSPAASIGDADAWAELGYLPVDVMWMEVVAEKAGALLSHTVTLMHRRYQWGGPCVSS